MSGAVHGTQGHHSLEFLRGFCVFGGKPLAVSTPWSVKGHEGRLRRIDDCLLEGVRRQPLDELPRKLLASSPPWARLFLLFLFWLLCFAVGRFGRSEGRE